ncbi:holo-ACP synthase [Bifidobacterium cuniculi]|uniref:Holo-[acyl-carrier-protein] synthase n=1 Tax=Bifidobacterium cuniculi TaxID=1688 RepID=A0A087AY68_9BIFI|nr:holo-ACP synthase [Bifidobacterium cuniculi]KFI63718.1 4'-phosphopantetheinyl transferase [Bifidobacterium cuniculi]
MILGLGHDVVDVAAFADQLAMPGTAMRRLFSARELRQAESRAAARHDDVAVHLAARWAAKESVLKAWCAALGGAPSPYTLDDFPWSAVETIDDTRGVPRIVLGADVEETLAGSLGQPAHSLHWSVSVSHDGPVASAVVVLEG